MPWVWSALLVLLTLGVLVLGPALSGHTAPAAVNSSNAKPEQLLIISPHWDGIREEFGRAFEAKMAEQGKSVRVVWLDLGGTGDIRRYLASKIKSGSLDADILFGGGVSDMERYIKDGYLEVHHPPAELLNEIPDKVNGQLLREPGPNPHWHAACLAGFGFVYNKIVAERARLPVPEHWTDLGRPEYLGWVSCGDPTRSGSLHQTFEIVLQAYGWEKGWPILARLCANTRAFNEGGASIPRDVALGQAAAGPCIDFYAAAPIRRQGATHLKFVLPPGAAVLTPDPVAVLHNPPHPSLAHAFMDFVLSEPGQRLWYQKRGTPGGPERFDLERLPVLKKIYGMNLETYTVGRPFDDQGAFQYDAKKGSQRWLILDFVMRACLMDPHEELYKTWSMAIKAGRAEELAPELFKAPMSEKELFEAAAKLGTLAPLESNAQRLQWSIAARERYADVQLKIKN